MMIIAIFELDPDTREAVGQNHPFCCHSCMEVSKQEVIDDIRRQGLDYAIDEDDSRNYDGATICEECRGSLEEVCP